MFRIKILEDAVVFLLEKIADTVGQFGIPGKFGIAIIIITILMRIVVFPLTLKQEKSMKKMRELQPEMDKIKEKYKDNPQEYQKRILEFQKENDINPLGGCWPILIQLPVFVALYYAFSGKTIPNDATFLWFNLKQPDKLFMMGNFAFNLLPILNTGVTYLQQKIMSGATKGQEGSNQLQSMMYTMPLMMLFLFYRMPSGVTLYYLVSGVLSLAQQYIIMKGRSDDGKDSIKSKK
jgi:membrane protein insertase, yidC/oxa1 family